jgi:hypothetical protein
VSHDRPTRAALATFSVIRHRLRLSAAARSSRSANFSYSAAISRIFCLACASWKVSARVNTFGAFSRVPCRR